MHDIARCRQCSACENVALRGSAWSLRVVFTSFVHSARTAESCFHSFSSSMGISESHRQQYIIFILILGLTDGNKRTGPALCAGSGPLD